MADIPDDSRLTAVGLLIEVHQGVLARTGAVHARHGLTHTDFDALIRLARSPRNRLRMSDLAAQSALSTSGITRVVDRLERRGLVCREASTDDRRSQSAVLTPDGLTRVEEELPELLAAIDEWFTGRLTPGQLDSLLDALHTVRAVVHPDAVSGAGGAERSRADGRSRPDGRDAGPAGEATGKGAGDPRVEG